MITSARTALCTRRSASRGSYDLLSWKSLSLDLLLSSSATGGIIVERLASLGQETPSASQRQHLRTYLAALHPEQCERVLGLPPPVRRTARVEQQKPVFVIEPGDM